MESPHFSLHYFNIDYSPHEGLDRRGPPSVKDSRAFQQEVVSYLEELWLRLRNVSYQTTCFDIQQLDDEDRAELDAISRITHGYAQFVIEAGDYAQSDDPIPFDAIREIGNAIHAHCDDSETALTYALQLQRKTNHHAVDAISTR